MFCVLCLLKNFFNNDAVSHNNIFMILLFGLVAFGRQ
jgi:hypothetical protein